MIICEFENSPSIPSFLVTDCLHWIWPVKKNDSFSFYLCIAVFLVFLYLIAVLTVSGSVLLLYAGAHKISLKYFFPEKMYVVKNARNVTQFVLQPFSIEFQGFVKKNKN
jgi:hypothetical protein